MAANITQAIRTGLAEGMKMALNPIAYSTSQEEKSPNDPTLEAWLITQEAWEMTGQSIREAMSMEADYHLQLAK